MGLLLPACLLQLVLGDAVTLDLGASIQGRVRTEVVSSQSVGEGELDPVVNIGRSGRQLSLSAGYWPQLVVSKRTQSQSGRQINHVGGGAAVWTPSPGFSLDASVSASRGTRDLLIPLSQGPSVGTTGGGSTGSGGAGSINPIQPLPGVSTVRYVSASASLGTTIRAGPSATLRLTLGVNEGGGDGTVARQSLPLQRSATADATLANRLTGADTLTSRLMGALTRVEKATGTPATTDGIVEIEERWDRRFSSQARGWLGLGPAYSYSRQEEQTTSRLTAAGDAGIAQNLRHPAVSTLLGLRVSPIVDQVTGSVNQRADVVAKLGWKASRAWSLSAGADGGEVLDGPQRHQIVWGGDGTIAWGAARYWSVMFTTRGEWQRAGATTTHQWFAGLSLAVADRFTF